jgi:hypothetical protein
VYINVIDEPLLVAEHPQWQRVDAKGNKSRVCNRPGAHGSGYLVVFASGNGVAYAKPSLPSSANRA